MGRGAKNGGNNPPQECLKINGAVGGLIGSCAWYSASSIQAKDPGVESSSMTPEASSAIAALDASTPGPSSGGTELARSIEGELLEVFQILDTNADGRISQQELLTFLRRLDKGASELTVQKMILGADFDGDGQISFEEFLRIHAFATEVSGAPDSDELLAVFGVFDSDRNGLISAKELQLALAEVLGEHVSEEECHQMIHRVDIDGDGCVDFYEFARMMEGSCGFASSTLPSSEIAVS